MCVCLRAFRVPRVVLYAEVSRKSVDRSLSENPSGKSGCVVCEFWRTGNLSGGYERGYKLQCELNSVMELF